MCLIQKVVQHIKAWGFWFSEMVKSWLNWGLVLHANTLAAVKNEAIGELVNMID